MSNSKLNLKKASTLKKLILITLIASILLVGGSFTGQPIKAASTPSGIVHSVPITITNSQSTATGSSFQQLITVDSTAYSSYEAYNLQNVEFYDSSGTVIPSWLEYGNSASSSTRFWVKIANGIAADSSVTIYMGFASTSTNLFDGTTVGEAPALSSTYGQYDNGANVFAFYDNFAGTTLSSSKWSILHSAGTYIVSNGITITGSSADWESISSTSTFNPQTRVFDTNAYFPILSSSGPKCFAGWNPPFGSTPQYYLGDTSGSYALYNYANDGVVTTATGVSTSGGSTYDYNIWSIWAGTSQSYLTLSYGSKTTNYQNFASSTSASIGLASQSSISAQWVRLRNLPPNSIMPTVTFGSATEQTNPTVNIYSPTIDGLTVTVSGSAEATTSDATISSISWSWGDGATASGDFPKIHTYDSAGSYTITVTATDSNGLTGSDSYTVYLTSGVTSTPSPIPVTTADSVACAFNGAYANYQVSYTVSGVSASAQIGFQVSNVDNSTGTFSVTTTVTGANGQDLSGLGLGAGTTTASYSNPAPIPIISKSALDDLKSAQTAQVSVTVPAGTFQTYQTTESGATVWVDANSGLIVKMSGELSGVSMSIELQSTNIGTSSAGAFPTLYLIIIVVVVIAVVAVLAVLLLVRKRKAKTKQAPAAAQSYTPPPPPPPPT